MTDCIFCKIITGDIPSTKVHEDDQLLVIMNIHPVTPGHLLIIPKQHFADTLEADDNVVSALALATKKIAPAVMTATGAPGFNLIVNTGAAAGQVIFHAHWHIIPRHDDDGLAHWPGNQNATTAEIEQVAMTIKSTLS